MSNNISARVCQVSLYSFRRMPIYMDSVSGNRENFCLVFGFGLQTCKPYRGAIIYGYHQLNRGDRETKAEISSASINVIIRGGNFIILSYGNGIEIGEDGATFFFKELPNIYICRKQNKYLR